MEIGTIFVGLLVAAGIAGAIVKIIRDKQKGKCCGCDGCTKKCSNMR